MSTVIHSPDFVDCLSRSSPVYKESSAGSDHSGGDSSTLSDVSRQKVPQCVQDMKKEYLQRKFDALPTIRRRKEIQQDRSTQQRAGPGVAGQVVTAVPESAPQLDSQVCA